MFVLAIFPFLFIGVGIATSLRRAGEAGAAIILFGNGLAPENIMRYDVVAFFNGVLAMILGVSLACLVQSLVFPDNANRRIVAATKRLTHWITTSIEKGKLTEIEYVGATVRPLNDLLALVDQSDELYRADWAIDLYALGHEIVNLQNARGDVTSGIADCSQETIQDISSLLQDPSLPHLLVAKGTSKNGYDSCCTHWQALIRIRQLLITSHPVLQNVNATFEWVRLAQRIPVRIKLVEVPNGTILSSGMTATVRIGPKPEGGRSDFGSR